MASGVGFELMQESTLMLLDRQFSATEVEYGQETASLYREAGCDDCNFGILLRESVPISR